MSDLLPETSQRVRDLLPWYVNGTLTEAERVDIEGALARSDELRAEVDWLAGMRDQLRQNDGLQPEMPRHAAGEATGLHNLLALVHAEKHQSASAARGRVISSPVAREGWRWKDWMRPLLVLAAVLVLGQAIVIGVLLGRLDANRLSPASGGTAATSGVLLQVVFREATTEKSLRTTLAAAEVEIVGGPGQLGVYLVRAAPDKANAALAVLKSSAAVESVTRITP